MAVWFLHNQESFRLVANLFGMPNKCTARYCIMQLCHVMATKLRDSYIRWPDIQQCETISTEFEVKSGFPGVIGCIDGTHIRVKPPAQDQDSFINRKGYPSVNVMAVCDNKMLFTDLFVDRAGSVHDARVLRVSPLGNRLEHGPVADPKFHILGDSAYPLLPQLITPYRDNGHLTPVQARFNTVHSATRSVVERAFARLKGKVRRLKGLECTHISNSLTIIEAGFVLHNFMLLHENIHDTAGEEDTADDTEDDSPQQDIATGRSTVIRQLAAAKRDRIAEALP